jgi:hypothetical protein
MTIYTSQFRYNNQDRIDITAKTSNVIGKIFAPPLNIVFDYKDGIIDEQQYQMIYTDIVSNTIPQLSEDINAFIKNEITFVCYCNHQTFCHRFILIDLLILHFPNIVYGGEKIYNKEQKSFICVPGYTKYGYFYKCP